MKKIELPIDRILEEIEKFYCYNQHHFITINAVDEGDNIEMQWFFCDYAYPSDITLFVSKVKPDTVIPSICKIISSAWTAEAELVDLLGINIENTKKGFVLEEDFEGSPLRKK